MPEKITAAQRSFTMRKVKSQDTTPELAVRRLLFRLGFRFRLHRKDLPGTPDIVLPKFGVAIFVHGCFWHQHRGCRRSTMPVSNVEYWHRKFEANMNRDLRNKKCLRKAGWRVLTIWECESTDTGALKSRLKSELR
jgi:DNA mismatch endonuclease (patch repair protein)